MSSPIVRYYLVLYLVNERNGSDGEKYEAYKNLSDSHSTQPFADKLVVFPLPNGTAIIRSHITHSQSLGENPATSYAALPSRTRDLLDILKTKTRVIY